MKYIGANIDDLYKNFGTYLPLIMEKLESFEKHLRNLSLYGDAMEGETADAIDAYINAVPLDIIHNFKNTITDYSALLTNAHTKFNTEIDADPKHINDDYLESLSRHIGLYSSFFASANVNVDSAYRATLHNGSPAIDVPKPDFELLRDRMHENKKWVDDAAKDFQYFNTAHTGDVAYVLEQLRTLKRLCVENSASKLQNGRYVHTSGWRRRSSLSLENIISIIEKYNVTTFPTGQDFENMMAQYDTMVSIDANGNRVYNWERIEELMANEAISLTDLQALTLVFLEMIETAGGYSADDNVSHFLSFGYEYVSDTDYSNIHLPATNSHLQRTNNLELIATLTSLWVSPIAQDTVWNSSWGRTDEERNSLSTIQPLVERLQIMDIITLRNFDRLHISNTSGAVNVAFADLAPFYISRSANGTPLLQILSGSGENYYYAGGFLVGGPAGVNTYITTNGVVYDYTMSFTRPEKPWYSGTVKDALLFLGGEALSKVSPIFSIMLATGDIAFSAVGDYDKRTDAEMFNATLQELVVIEALGGRASVSQNGTIVCIHGVSLNDAEAFTRASIYMTTIGYEGTVDEFQAEILNGSDPGLRNHFMQYWEYQINVSDTSYNETIEELDRYIANNSNYNANSFADLPPELRQTAYDNFIENGDIAESGENYE